MFLLPSFLFLPPPHLSLSLSLSFTFNHLSSLSLHSILSTVFSLSLSFCDLSLSAYLVLNYPNSISVQLQFIPVSKRQSRRVHFASAPPPEAIISFLHTSPLPSPFQPGHTSPFAFFWLSADWLAMMNARLKCESQCIIFTLLKNCLFKKTPIYPLAVI